MHQYPIGLSEATEVIANVPAANRVRASDGRIELSLRQAVVIVFTVNGFDSFTDWVEFAVQ